VKAPRLEDSMNTHHAALALFGWVLVTPSGNLFDRWYRVYQLPTFNTCDECAKHQDQVRSDAVAHRNCPRPTFFLDRDQAICIQSSDPRRLK